MVFLVCRIVAHGKVVVPDIVKEADEGLSFAAFFLANFDSDKYSLLEVYLADDGCGKNSIQTELHHPLKVALTFGKTYVKFVVSDADCDAGTEGESSLVNVLMSSARRQAHESRKNSKPQLPEKISPEKKKNYNQKDELYNAVLGMLGNKGKSFPNAQVACNEGKAVIRVLTDVLWHIDEHHEKLNARAKDHKEMPSIPPLFSSFRGFNDSAKKKKAARLDCSILVQDVQNLYHILTYSALQADDWADIHAALKQLAECVNGYTEHLRAENDKQKERQLVLEPVRTPLKNFEVYEREATSKVSSMYLALDLAIGKLNEYDPIHLDAKFTPVDKRRRYEYLHDLKLSVPVEVFRYSRSGSLGTMTFVWKLPIDKKERSTARSVTVIDSIRSSIPLYHTRSMRKEFCSQFGLICKVSPLMLNEIYRSLTGDASAIPNPEIVDRLRTLLHSDALTDSSVVVDLRELNEGRPSQYTRFWELLQEVLYEYNEAAASDRRHSHAQMPVAMSIPDLSQKVQDKIPPEEQESVKIPSNEWIRLQFLPRSPHSHASLRFVKQFDIRFQVQRRILRANHEDAHYAAAQFRYLREFCVCQKQHCTFLSMDDKHSISVGEPNAAVASLDRGRRVLTAAGTQVVALDHDFTKAKLTPSVVLAINIPDSITESFYRGRVFVDVRDAIFSPSSALKHSQEVIDILDKTHQIQPVLALFTDGGPDHRPTLLSVQLALIALFRRLNLDMLVAARTAPGHSFINPVERIMSLLNIALYGVALERSKMSEQFESVLSRCNSMSEIRSAAANSPGMEEEFCKSLAEPARLVSERFSQLCLKDEPFTSVQGSTIPEEITDLFRSVKEIDPNIEISDTTQKALSKLERLKRFLNMHTIRHHYIFQVKKCANRECEFGCKPVLPPDIFSKLAWVPDPVLVSTTDQYLPFQDLYGKVDTTEKDRPSFKEPVGADAQNKELLVSTKARCTVVCCACNKPRVIYSKFQLPSGRIRLLQGISEDCFYVCGAQLPLTSTSEEPPVVREGINCNSPVEFAYYSSKKFKNVCAHCGSDDCTIDQGLKEQFQTVLPTCRECYASGKKPLTRGKFREKRRNKDTEPNRKKQPRLEN